MRSVRIWIISNGEILVPTAVIGASGFIGSHVLQMLRVSGQEVVGITRSIPEVASHSVAVSDPPLCFVDDLMSVDEMAHVLRIAGIQLVINCAGWSSTRFTVTDMQAVIDANVLLPTRLALAAKSAEVPHFVHVSSAACYAVAALSENQKNEYGALKAAADLALTAAGCATGLRTSIVCAPNIFGSRQRSSNFVPSLITRLDAGVRIEVWRNAVREWLYVEDFCRALWLVASSPVSGGYYAVSGERLEPMEVASILRLAMGSSSDLVAIDSPIHARDHRSPPNGMKSLHGLGWQPVVGASEGLRETARAYARVMTVERKTVGSLSNRSDHQVTTGTTECPPGQRSAN